MNDEIMSDFELDNYHSCVSIVKLIFWFFNEFKLEVSFSSITSFTTFTIIIIITTTAIIAISAIFSIYIARFVKSFIAWIIFVNIVLILFIINIIFINLNISARIVEIYARLNMMFNDIFNDNKNKYELLNMFKKIVNNDDERIRFWNKIE